MYVTRSTKRLKDARLTCHTVSTVLTKKKKIFFLSQKQDETRDSVDIFDVGVQSYRLFHNITYTKSPSVII